MIIIIFWGGEKKILMLSFLPHSDPSNERTKEHISQINLDECVFMRGTVDVFTFGL